MVLVIIFVGLPCLLPRNLISV